MTKRKNICFCSHTTDDPSCCTSNILWSLKVDRNICLCFALNILSCSLSVTAQTDLAIVLSSVGASGPTAVPPTRHDPEDQFHKTIFVSGCGLGRTSGLHDVERFIQKGYRAWPFSTHIIRSCTTHPRHGHEQVGVMSIGFSFGAILNYILVLFFDSDCDKQSHHKIMMMFFPQ